MIVDDVDSNYKRGGRAGYAWKLAISLKLWVFVVSNLNLFPFRFVSLHKRWKKGSEITKSEIFSILHSLLYGLELKLCWIKCNAIPRRSYSASTLLLRAEDDKNEKKLGIYIIAMNILWRNEMFWNFNNCSTNEEIFGKTEI